MPIAIAQKVWLITGCSSGLGHSLAMAALNNGHKVIATSRNPTRTPDLVRGVEAHGGHWLEFDVCGQRVDEVLDEALKIHGHIDVLVNNAGAGIYGAVEDCSDEDARAQMELNYFAPLKIIRTLLPSMRARKSGTIVNISSSAGFVVLPACGIYGASKHALEGMSEALAQEIAPLGLRVLLVEPGGFRTSFAASTILREANVGYQDTPADKVIKAIPTMIGKQLGSVEKGAQRIFDAVMGTGLAANIELDFLRLPLGTDCGNRMLNKLNILTKTIEKTKCLWESTDIKTEESFVIDRK